MSQAIVAVIAGPQSVHPCLCPPGKGGQPLERVLPKYGAGTLPSQDAMSPKAEEVGTPHGVDESRERGLLQRVDELRALGELEGVWMLTQDYPQRRANCHQNQAPEVRGLNVFGARPSSSYSTRNQGNYARLKHAHLPCSTRSRQN